MMDISSEGSEIKPNRMAPLMLDLPAGPLTPWLRLAHFTRTEPAESAPVTRKRTLLDFELVLQCEGMAWIWVEELGGSLDVAPGSIVFIPPGFAHGWSNITGLHIAVHLDLHFQPDVRAFGNFRMTNEFVTRQPVESLPSFSLGQSGSPLILPLITPLRHPEQMRERLERLVRIYQTQAQADLAAQLVVNEVLCNALVTIAEDAAASGPGWLSPESKVEQRILALLNELAVTKQTQLSSAELAERCGMSQTTFRQAFLKITGRNPHQYFEQLRIERAAQLLLQTERTINSIALAEGYDDPYHFSRVFKRVMGSSPYQFRQKGQRQDKSRS